VSVARVGDLDIAYTQAGAGPGVALLHGYVGDGASTWQPQLDRLAEDFAVVAWDAPGAGGSSDPPEGWGVAGYSDALAGFLDVLGWDAAHLVGLSFGGIVALDFAVRHPGLTRRLVLVSAYAGWAGSLGAEAARDRLVQARRLSELSPDQLVDALLPTMFRPDTPPAVVRRFGDGIRSFHPAGFRAMAYASSGDLRQALSAVRAPTLVVCGAEDVRAPRRVAEGLHAGIDGSSLVVLPDAGHVCNLESPSAFDAAVAGFLREDDPRSG
jgi:pimeloyl-ACP methyl ester carboxylesterase